MAHQSLLKNVNTNIMHDFNDGPPLSITDSGDIQESATTLNCVHDILLVFVILSKQP